MRFPHFGQVSPEPCFLAISRLHGLPGCGLAGSPTLISERRPPTCYHSRTRCAHRDHPGSSNALQRIYCSRAPLGRLAVETLLAEGIGVRDPSAAGNTCFGWGRPRRRWGRKASAHAAYVAGHQPIAKNRRPLLRIGPAPGNKRIEGEHRARPPFRTLVGRTVNADRIDLRRVHQAEAGSRA